MNLSVAETRARGRRVGNQGRDGRGTSQGNRFLVELRHFLGPSATSYHQFGPHSWTYFFILFLKYIWIFFFYKLTPIHCEQTRMYKKVKAGRNQNQA